jgi:putative MATE family efflux protein
VKNSYASYRNIFTIAWPVMLGSLGQNVIYLVDTSFLGRVSEYDLGASAIGGIFYFLLFMIGYGLNTGMQVIVARRKGEKKDAAIGEVVDHEIRIILIVAALEFILMYFFSEKILATIIHSDVIREKTLQFLHFRSFGIFCGLLNSLFMSFFIGIGNTKVTTWTTGVLVVVNLFLLYCLVFGNLGFPAMGIAGAGLASSIAEASVTVVMMFYLFRKKIKHEYRLFEFLKTKTSLMIQMLKLAGPLVFQQLISVGSWWIFFLAIEHLGERQLAISNLIRSMYTMYGVPVWALASTTNSMTSNLIGQGKSNDVIPLIKKVSVISISFAALFSVVVLLFPSATLSIFTNEKELIAESIPTLYTVLLAISLFSVAILVMFGVMGTGATRVSFYVEVICIIAYLTYIYFTAIRMEYSLPVIWLAEVVYWVIALTLCSLYLKYGNWRTKQV